MGCPAASSPRSGAAPGGRQRRGVQVRLAAASRGRAERQVPLCREVEGKFGRGGGGRARVLRVRGRAGPGRREGVRGWRVRLGRPRPRGEGSTWSPFAARVPPPRPRAGGRALRPRFRAPGLGRAGVSGAAAPAAARGGWRPRAGRWEAGPSRRAAAPPRISRKRDASLLGPRGAAQTGGGESAAGAEWGWESGSGPGSAAWRGRGRTGGHPKAGSPESRRPSGQEMRGSERRRQCGHLLPAPGVLRPAHASQPWGPLRQAPGHCPASLLLF